MSAAGVSRIGHMGLRVADLGGAVAFHEEVQGLRVTAREGNRAYLTCNERHHELVLIQSAERGYDHVGLEVADPAALDELAGKAGAAVIGEEDEPGVERAVRILGPEGHVFKLFTGMECEAGEDPGVDTPLKFEHVSLKVRHMGRMERFISELLGFRFSDRMGPLASWHHCDDDHHGLALVRAPRAELAHYAWAWPDLNALGRVADRLRRGRGQRLVWGPSRHGPGHNHFIYFKDADGALIEGCSALARMDDYQPRDWGPSPKSINQWGGSPPLRFLLAGHPISPAAGKPSSA